MDKKELLIAFQMQVEKNSFLEQRCKELWEENESLKFKLTMRGLNK